MDSYLLRNVREIGIVNIINDHLMFWEHQEKNKKVLDEIKKIEHIPFKLTRNGVKVSVTKIIYSDRFVFYFWDTPENKELKTTCHKKEHYRDVRMSSRIF